MDVKDLGSIAKKFVDVTPQRSGEYENGVRNPRRDWAQATAAAEQSYKDGVAAAITRGSFGKGVRKAGTSKQQKGALDKGVSRFGPGVAVSGDAFQQGFSPYHQVIASTTLPPRFARRDPRNLARVAVVATALGKAKESQLGK
jgi:hypothetical protein